MEHKKYPFVKELKSLLNINTDVGDTSSPDIPQKPLYLLQHFDNFMRMKESDFSLRSKRVDSIKDYRNVYFYLEDYEKYLNKVIKLDDVNKYWLNGFVKFLETPREERRYFSKGNLVGKTIKKRIVMLLSFFRWLDAEGIFPFPKNIKGYSKNIVDSPTVKTTLTKEEVMKILAFNTYIKQHEFVRDVFVFACYTGLRWSDLISLDKKNIKFIDGIGHVIDKQTMKTKEKVIVPLNTVAYNIGIKWDFKFNLYPNATFNKWWV